jgi:hypothetical protein
MLDLLSLVVVADLHLLVAHTFVLFLKAFLLVGKCFERHHDFLDFVLALLQHLLQLTALTVEAFSLTTPVLLIASRLLDLAIFNLDEFTKVFIFLLQGLVL